MGTVGAPPGSRLELTQERRRTGSADTPQKGTIRETRWWAGWVGEVHLCTQIGSFKNIIYDLYPTYFQKQFGKGKKTIELCKEKRRLITWIIIAPNQPQVLFGTSWHLSKKGGKKGVLVTDLCLHAQIFFREL